MGARASVSLATVPCPGSCRNLSGEMPGKVPGDLHATGQNAPPVEVLLGCKLLASWEKSLLTGLYITWRGFLAYKKRRGRCQAIERMHLKHGVDCIRAPTRSLGMSLWTSNGVHTYKRTDVDTGLPNALPRPSSRLRGVDVETSF